jgi:beta-galactosidase/beta-glucuronidase
VASLRDEKGKEEKRFTQTVNVAASPTQRVQVSWPWSNPRLWDVDQPNLYNLHLQVLGRRAWTTSRSPASAFAKLDSGAAMFI